ncbi:hypothetical protein B484DRAFT_425261, partial [Ochromonadaceae sp. CCMP2298]
SISISIGSRCNRPAYLLALIEYRGGLRSEAGEKATSTTPTSTSTTPASNTTSTATTPTPTVAPLQVHRYGLEPAPIGDQQIFTNLGPAPAPAPAPDPDPVPASVPVLRAHSRLEPRARCIWHQRLRGHEVGSDIGYWGLAARFPGHELRRATPPRLKGLQRSDAEVGTQEARDKELPLFRCAVYLGGEGAENAYPGEHLARGGAWRPLGTPAVLPPPPPATQKHSCHWAARAYRLHVLQWLRAQDPPCPWDEATCTAAAAAAGGAATATTAAAHGDRLDVLRWLRTQGGVPCCEGARLGYVGGKPRPLVL